MAFGYPPISFIGYPVSVPCPGHAGLGFREAGPGDGPAILAHLRGLSAEDRHLRFCGTLSDGALAFLAASRNMPPTKVGEAPAPRTVLRELETVHRGLIAVHLEKTLKSDRVLRELRRGQTS